MRQNKKGPTEFFVAQKSTTLTKEKVQFKQLVETIKPENRWLLE